MTTTYEQSQTQFQTLEEDLHRIIQTLSEANETFSTQIMETIHQEVDELNDGESTLNNRIDTMLDTINEWANLLEDASGTLRVPEYYEVSADVAIANSLGTLASRIVWKS